MAIDCAIFGHAHAWHPRLELGLVIAANLALLLDNC